MAMTWVGGSSLALTYLCCTFKWLSGFYIFLIGLFPQWVSVVYNDLDTFLLKGEATFNSEEANTIHEAPLTGKVLGEALVLLWCHLGNILESPGGFYSIHISLWWSLEKPYIHFYSIYAHIHYKHIYNFTVYIHMYIYTVKIWVFCQTSA